MTNAEKTIKEIDRILSEFASGWVFVGFTIDGEPMSAVSVPSGKEEVGINAILQGILSAGGVGALRDQIKAKEKETEGE
jgi:hypothetical protein